MTTLDNIMERVKLLVKEAKTPPKHPIRPEVLQAAMAGIDALIEELRKAGPLGKKELDTAIAHKISKEIAGFVSLDKDRKAFFTTDYFKQKFEKLPTDRMVVSALIKGSKPSAYLNPLLLYHFASNSGNNNMGLQALLDEIRSDYTNSAPVKEKEAARALFRKLLAAKSAETIATQLQDSFPTEEQLKNFSKIINVKIPGQSRGKGAPKKSAHQRLADAIYHEGGVVRMEVS
jgi:hypothetical protein